jgi:hypothetical protein
MSRRPVGVRVRVCGAPERERVEVGELGEDAGVRHDEAMETENSVIEVAFTKQGLGGGVVDHDEEAAYGHLVAIEHVAQPVWLCDSVEAERREERPDAAPGAGGTLVRAAARVLLSLRRMRMSTSLGSALSRSVRGGRRGGGDLCL